MGAGGTATILAQIGLFFSIELNEKAPVGYLLLLGLGVALFAIGSVGLWIRRFGDVPATVRIPFSASLQPTSFGSFGSTIALLAGAIAVGTLIALLAAGSTWGWTLVPWILAVGAFGVPFLPQFRLAKVPLLAWLRDRYVDVILVLAVMAAFIGLNLVDLQDWYYSAIGDEFLFFEHAKHIAESGVDRPFSQEGVYNKHPVMNSVFQAAVMRVFGVDYFGWTFSEVLNAAIAIPGIYLLGHIFGGRKTAVISAALFASSHVIFAFSHVGYNNLSPIPVAVWSLALFIHGWRRGNPMLLYAAGVIAGLGFYTHYSGRAILPVMMLFALTAASPRRLLDLWPMVLGFALTVAPTFVVEQEQVFTRMFNQAVGGYTEVVSGSTVDRILNNIEINLTAFNYNSTVHSYVYGPLMDPVSAVLAVLGIGFALGHIRQPCMRLLLIWFGIGVFMTGILSPYPHVAITRLSFVVPPLALLAGVLVGTICEAIRLKAENFGPIVTRSLVSCVLLSLIAVVVALNLWQFWHNTPSVFPHKPEAVAIGAYRSEHCSSDATGTVFVGKTVGQGSLLYRALSAFEPKGPLPRMVEHEDLAQGMDLPGEPPGCIVFSNPQAPEALTLQQGLVHQYPDGRLLSFKNPSGTTEVAVFSRSPQ